MIKKTNVAETIEEIKDGVMGSYLRPRIAFAIEKMKENETIVEQEALHLWDETAKLIDANDDNEKGYSLNKTLMEQAKSTFRHNGASIVDNETRDENSNNRLHSLDTKIEILNNKSDEVQESDKQLSDDINYFVEANNKTQNDIDEFINLINDESLVNVDYFRQAYISNTLKGVTRNTTIKGHTLKNLVERSTPKKLTIYKPANTPQILTIKLEVPVKKGSNITILCDVLNTTVTTKIQCQLLNESKTAVHWPTLDNTIGRQCINYMITADDIYYIRLYMDTTDYNSNKTFVINNTTVLEGTYDKTVRGHELGFDNISSCGENGMLSYSSANNVVADDSMVTKSSIMWVDIGQDIYNNHPDDGMVNKRATSQVLKVYRTPITIKCDKKYSMFISLADESGIISGHVGWSDTHYIENTNYYCRAQIKKVDNSDFTEEDDINFKVVFGRDISKSDKVQDYTNIKLPMEYGLKSIPQNGENTVSDHLCDSVIQEKATGKIYAVERVKRFIIDSTLNWEISPTWTNDKMIFFKCMTNQHISAYTHKFLVDKIFTPIYSNSTDMGYCRDNELEAIVQSAGQWGPEVSFGIFLKKSRGILTPEQLKEFFRTSYNIVVYAKMEKVVMHELTNITMPIELYRQDIDNNSYETGTLIISDGYVKPHITLQIPKKDTKEASKAISMMNQSAENQNRTNMRLYSIESTIDQDCAVRNKINKNIDERLCRLERR